MDFSRIFMDCSWIFYVTHNIFVGLFHGFSFHILLFLDFTIPTRLPWPVARICLTYEGLIETWKKMVYHHEFPMIFELYPLVNVYITMKNHHV